MKSKKGRFNKIGKYVEGGQTPVDPPKATTQDSLDVYNSSQDFDRAINALGYSKDEDSSSPSSIPYYKMDGETIKAVSPYGGGRPRQRITSASPGNSFMLDSDIAVKGTAWEKSSDPRKRIGPGHYYLKDLGNYKYEANELLSGGGLNTDLPQYLMDARIEPQGTSTYRLSGTDPDIAEFPYYDHIAIKPYALLTPEEKKLRVERYGNPTTSSHTPEDTSRLTPPKPYIPNMDTDLSAFLKSEGKSFSYADRKKLATEYGITDYKGSANQNMELLNMVKKGVPVNTPEVKKEITPTPKEAVATPPTNKKIMAKPKPILHNKLDGYSPDDYIEIEHGDSAKTTIEKVKVSELKKWKTDDYKILTPTKMALGGAVSGAMSGAQMGAMFGPIGMGVGALAGGLAGNYMENQNMPAEGPPAEGITNQNPYGAITMEEGGIGLNNPFINIEMGELLVDPESGDIIEEYSKERGFKPHSKKGAEDPRNFIKSEGGVVIPKRMANKYKNKQEFRAGYLRDVVNLQSDRMMYGEDANGNKVEFSQIQKDFKKMKEGGFTAKYALGGIDPPKTKYMSGFSAPAGFESITASDFQAYAGLPTDNTWGENTQNAWNSIGANYYTSRNTPTPQSKGLSNNPFGVSNELPKTVSNELPKTSQVPPPGQNIDTGLNAWTRGNTIGAIGTGISALGPLAVTLANGQDKEENNYYSNVSTRAEGEVGNIYRGVEQRGVRDINTAANTAYGMNRNRSTGFAGMLSNAQNINRGTQTNLSDFLNSTANSKANTMSQLMFKGDMANAEGLTRMDERLDANRDNFYSNVNKDVSNIGMNVQNYGRQDNQNMSNNVKLNILRQISPDFSIDKAGNVTFQGNIVEDPLKGGN